MSSSSSVLERLGSLVPSEIERTTKKIRNKKGGGCYPHKDLTMEENELGQDSFKEVLLMNVDHKDGNSVGDIEKDELIISNDDVKVGLEGPYLEIFLSDRVKGC